MTRTPIAITIAAGLLLGGCSAFRAENPDVSLTPSASDTRALIAQADPRIQDDLSPTEREVLADAESRALNFGQTGDAVRWTGDDAKTSGLVQAQSAFRVGTNTCRKFVHSLSVDGNSRQATATACRSGDGDWQLIS